MFLNAWIILLLDLLQKTQWISLGFRIATQVIVKSDSRFSSLIVNGAELTKMNQSMLGEARKQFLPELSNTMNQVNTRERAVQHEM